MLENTTYTHTFDTPRNGSHFPWTLKPITSQQKMEINGSSQSRKAAFSPQRPYQWDHHHAVLKVDDVWMDWWMDWMRRKFQQTTEKCSMNFAASKPKISYSSKHFEKKMPKVTCHFHEFSEMYQPLVGWWRLMGSFGTQVNIFHSFSCQNVFGEQTNILNQHQLLAWLYTLMKCIPWKSLAAIFFLGWFRKHHCHHFRRGVIYIYHHPKGTTITFSSRVYIYYI